MKPRLWLFLAPFLLIWSTAGIVEPIKKIGWKPLKETSSAQIVVGFAIMLVVVQSFITLPTLPAHLKKKDSLEQTAIFLKDYIQEDDLVTASVAWLPSLRYYFNYHEIPRGHIRQSGKFQRAFIIVNNTQGNETLRSVSPKLGFDIPVIDMDSVKVLLQFEDFTVYECYPAQ